jgi:hypothetical protein
MADAMRRIMITNRPITTLKSGILIPIPEMSIK